MAKVKPEYHIVRESPLSWKVEKYIGELHSYDYFVYGKAFPDGKGYYLECDPHDDTDPEGWRCPASANGYWPCKHVKMVQLRLQNGTDVCEIKFLFTSRPPSGIIDNGGVKNPPKERRPTMATQLKDEVLKGMTEKQKEAYGKLLEAREKGDEGGQRKARRMLRASGIYLSKLEEGQVIKTAPQGTDKPKDEADTKPKDEADEEDEDEPTEKPAAKATVSQGRGRDARAQRRAS